jgi:protein TonB
VAPSKVKWWHCLPISLFVHAIFIAAALFWVSDTLSMRLVTPVPTEHLRMSVTPVAVFYQDSIAEAPPAADMLEDPFESTTETPALVPDIQFEPPTSAPQIPSVDADDLLPEPEKTPDTPSTPPVQPDVIDSPVPAEQKPAHEQASEQKTAHEQASGSPQINTANLKPSKPATTPPSTSIQTPTHSESPAPSSQDESAIWREYTRQLSAHFKNRRHYPEMAKKLRLTGTVWVILELRRDGTLIQARIKTSSGYSILDQAALTSAQKAVPAPPFPPQTQAQQKSILIPYHYKM